MQDNEAEKSAPPDIAATPGGRPEQALLPVMSLFFMLLALELLLHFLLYPRDTHYEFLLIMPLFCLSYALIISFAGGLFPPPLSMLINIIPAALFTLLALAQYIYFQFFKTPLLLFSLSRAADVMEYLDSTLRMMWRHLPQLLILLLPLLGFICFVCLRRGLFVRERRQVGLSRFAAAVIVWMLALASLQAGGEAPGSAYSCYFNENSPELAQERLGLISAARLDLKRSLFGFSPRNAPQTTLASLDALADEDDAAAGEGSGEPEEIPVVYAPNALDIDFAALAAQESSDELRALHEYFAALPITPQNEYTGLFADCNLIMITAEAFSHLLLNEPTLFPAIHRLATEGFEFTNFYNPIWNVSTSDGEYTAMLGLLPDSNYWSFSRSSENYLPFALGHQFAACGYSQPRAYHNHTYTYYDRHLSHPNLGYDYRGRGNGLAVSEQWPESDLEMMQNSVDDWIGEERFHAYYMTVSGHLEYNFYGNMMAEKNREAVAELPYSDEVKAYIACNLELEYALEYLLERLEQAGKLENSVIVFGADHYPYGLSDTALDELAGHAVERNFELYRNTLIIWKPGLPHQIIETPACSLDILPTVSNLFALPFDSRLLMGRDIFSDAMPLVIFNNRSWISDKASYNSQTAELLGDVGAEYAAAVNSMVAARFLYSAQMLKTDYYRRVLGE